MNDLDNPGIGCWLALVLVVIALCVAFLIGVEIGRGM